MGDAEVEQLVYVEREAVDGGEAVREIDEPVELTAKAKTEEQPTFESSEPYWGTEAGLRHRLNDLEITLLQSRSQATDFAGQAIYRALEADAEVLRSKLQGYGIQDQEPQEALVEDKIETTTTRRLSWLGRRRQAKERAEESFKEQNEKARVDRRYSELMKTINNLVQAGAPERYILNNGEQIQVESITIPGIFGNSDIGFTICLGDLKFGSGGFYGYNPNRSEYGEVDTLEFADRVLIQDGKLQFGVSIEDRKVWTGVFRNLATQVYEKMQEAQVKNNQILGKALEDVVERYS